MGHIIQHEIWGEFTGDTFPRQPFPFPTDKLPAPDGMRLLIELCDEAIESLRDRIRKQREINEEWERGRDAALYQDRLEEGAEDEDWKYNLPD